MALPKNQGKAHRVLARELKVSEANIRRDRRALAHLDPDRCSLRARPRATVVRSYDWKSPRYLERMLKAGRRWIWNEDLRRAEWNQIAPRIHAWLAHDCRGGEPPAEVPATALERLRPENLDINDCDAYFHWLLNWLEYCLPGDRPAQRSMLDDIGRKVRP
ncbi:MAG: hypothetical protein WCC14_17160 [Acidobacteriaceae bacterium]